MQYICSLCGKTASTDILAPKCECGGLWQLDWQPPKFSLDDVDRSVWGMFRYHNYIPVAEEAWKAVTLGEGMTPIRRKEFPCRP